MPRLARAPPRVVECEDDAAHRLVRRTDPEGYSQWASYDANGRAAIATD